MGPEIGHFPLPVSLLMERDPWVCAGGYKHLAPLERKRIPLLPNATVSGPRCHQIFRRGTAFPPIGCQSRKPLNSPRPHFGYFIPVNRHER